MGGGGGGVGLCGPNHTCPLPYPLLPLHSMLKVAMCRGPCSYVQAEPKRGSYEESTRLAETRLAQNSVT